jgi:hypothetical protein
MAVVDDFGKRPARRSISPTQHAPAIGERATLA